MFWYPKHATPPATALLTGPHDNPHRITSARRTRIMSTKWTSAGCRHPVSLHQPDHPSDNTLHGGMFYSIKYRALTPAPRPLPRYQLSWIISASDTSLRLTDAGIALQGTRDSSHCTVARPAIYIFITATDGHGPDDVEAGQPAGRLKMREWKMRYEQNCKGGKCRSKLYGAPTRVYIDKILN